MIQQEGSRMFKSAYSTILPFDPIPEDGLSGSMQAPSPFPKDMRGRPMTMLHAYYRARRENPMQAMPAFEPSDAYWHAMLLRSQLQQQYQGLGGVMRPVDLYRTKLAAEYDDRVDPILLHPMLAAKPKTLDELGDRRYDYQRGLGIGGTLGALGGAALSYALHRHGVENGARAVVPLVSYGALGGATLGAVGALGKRFLSNVDRHDQAVRDFESQRNTRLPFTVRHPYMSTIGVQMAGAVGGAAAGAAIGKSLGIGALQGATIGGIGSNILTPVLGLAAQQERETAIRPYINPERLKHYGLSLASAYQD